MIPLLGRLRQEECEFENSVDYIGRSCLKKEKKVQYNKFRIVCHERNF
jgi:hypothetical protein